jgi:PAS domain S-box-containing protein
MVDAFPLTTRVGLESIAAQVSGTLARIHAETALRESEERYRTLFNESTDSVMVLELQDDFSPGAFVQVNATACQQLGYTRDELMTLTPRDIAALDDSDQRIAIAAALKEKRKAIFETGHITKQGVRIPVEVHIRVIDFGGRAAALAIARDISDRKRAQESARLDQRRITALLSLTQRAAPSRKDLLEAALDEAVALSNSEMGFIHYWTEDAASSREQASHNESEQAAPTLELLALFGSDAPDFWRNVAPQRAHTIVNEESPAQASHDAQPPSVRAFQRHMTIPINSGDRIVATVAVTGKATDYTEIDAAQLTQLMDSVWKLAERRDAELALHESEARYRRLFDEATEGIALADSHTGIMLDCNQAFLKMTGYTRDEILGQPQSVLHPSEPAGDAVSHTFAKHRAENSGETLVTKLVTRSGAIKNVEIKGSVININGRPVMQAFFRDTTEEQRGRREREMTLSLLRLLNDQQHTHELVRALLGFVQEETACDAVGIRLRQGEDFTYYETVGFSDDFVASENCLCAHELPGAEAQDSRKLGTYECLCGMVLSGTSAGPPACFTAKGSFWTNGAKDLINSLELAELPPRFRGRCIREGYESIALIPLRYSEQTLGLLQIADKAPSRFTPELIAFLENAGDQIGLALAQRQLQAALLASEARFRELCANARDAIVMTDDTGHILYFNGAAEAMFGYTADAVLGKELNAQLGIPRYQDAVKLELQRSRETAPGASVGNVVELEARRNDGSAFSIELSFATLKIQSGWNVIGIVRDISGRIKAENERRQLQVDLAHAQKMDAVGQLAGGVAHDFNNLLQVITGNLDLMMNDLLPTHPVYEGMTEIQAATERAISLVRQLLLFSRKSELKLETVDVDKMVEGLLKMLRRLIGEHIDLHFEPSGTPLRVNADPGQLEQVLMNLCINSRDAMPNGGRLTIATQLIYPGTKFKDGAAPEPTETYALLTVTDTGFGIAPEARDRVFEPFYSTKAIGHGTGLGLATVFAIVERHHGVIEFASEPGQGTTFRVYIPTITSQHRTQAARSDVSGAVAPGAGKTILLAEDDEPIRRLTQGALERAGYRVLAAHDGEQALQLFEQNIASIDLAVLDMVMPKRTGRSVLDAIRQLKADLPIIFITGYSGDELDADAYEYENTELIQKPFPAKVLLKRISTRLVCDSSQQEMASVHSADTVPEADRSGGERSPFDKRRTGINTYGLAGD